MSTPIRILLQTTVPSTNDDWGIDRLSMLRDYLVSLQDDAGHPACDVVARVGGASLKENRQLDADGDDPILSTLGDADFDELWLFALDMGDGLSSKDCAGIAAFHRSGGGILTTRDHQDLGICLYGLGEIGALHFFQSRHLDPDTSQHCIDDTGTPTISWPNYHSGRNGDYQRITPVEPIHPLLRNPAAPSGIIELFPSHPHEGGVGVPAGSKARVIATGISQTTGRSFNLVVASDRLGGALRVRAEPTRSRKGYRWQKSRTSYRSINLSPLCRLQLERLAGMSELRYRTRGRRDANRTICPGGYSCLRAKFSGLASSHTQSHHC